VPALEDLRARAVSHSLFEPTTLKAALERMAFVQADPIRSPARAQDLILRHRVSGYRAGHLEREYSELEIEEDTLYAYGFVSRSVWRLLQPRRQTTRLATLEKKVLEIVRQSGPMHPRDLEAHLGRRRVINDWGGYSAATTRSLELLHHRGLLRIARRERGIRVYEPANPFENEPSPEERLRKLILVVARVLAPSLEKTLRAIVARYRYWGNPRKALDDLLRSGELERQPVNGLTYLWPQLEKTAGNAPRQVRFLAPFDPLVWDRKRFQHFWGWEYRFEAYTPPTLRVLGYYAMPMLWGRDVIGWANVSVQNSQLCVQPGFVGRRPSDSTFRSELEHEVERLRTFLHLDSA